ncbi:MAG: radical SAM protein [Acidobacteriota bacterium]|nr:radical SAM protein [Acidobacteriota bacterium]
MAGAMAGTAILNSSLSQKLQTVTLTINNKCNLSCPHCYLQYNSNLDKITAETLELVSQSQFKHLSIVGKEPLVDSTSISISEKISKLASQSSKTISLITNGLNLSMVKPEFLKNLSYIDISFDGGPETYEKYRNGSLSKLIRGLEHLRNCNFLNVNALHVLNTETIGNVDDMMKVRDYFNFRHIMFSPYVNTSNFGLNSVRELKIESIISALSQSKLFRAEPKAFLLVGADNLTSSNKNHSIEDLTEKYGMGAKIKIIKEDPLLYGIIRVTYDGFALTPYQSLNTINYQKTGINLTKLNRQNRLLQDVYKTMRNADCPLNN